MTQKEPLKIEDLPLELQDIAESLGVDTVLKLVDLRQGERLYLPQMKTLNRLARNKKIKEEFNGLNYEELAKKYKLTGRAIRRIINK